MVGDKHLQAVVCEQLDLLRQGNFGQKLQMANIIHFPHFLHLPRHKLQTPCPASLSTAMINIMTRSNFGKKPVSVILQLLGHTVLLRELRAEPGSRN